jgi:hypothetical protein
MSHPQASIRIREHPRGSYNRRRYGIPDVRMARVFDIRQSHAAYQQLICANGRRRVVAESAGGGDEVVLINAVAADADCAHQNAVFVECGAAREDLKAVRQDRSVRNRRTIRHRSASQNDGKSRFDQRDLQSVIEWAPKSNVFRERAVRSAVDPVGEERTGKGAHRAAGERVLAVERHAELGRLVGVFGNAQAD